MLAFRSSWLTLHLLCFTGFVFAQNNNNQHLNIRNGEAQIVAGFDNPKEWIKEELWVETSFDSDNDGKLDRMHVFLTRPKQTETEGIKLPVIYMTSPYFAGVGGNSSKYLWNVKHELGATPPPHKHPKVKRKNKRSLECFFNDRSWVRRGFVTVYSDSPGTGFSDGSPTVGGENESLAPKAVIDWLCGRGKGYKTRTGTEPVLATWCTGKVGMTGTSYNGALCLAAACTGVQGLEAIIPIAPVSSWYRYYRSNGLVRSPGGYLGEDMDVLYDFVHSGDPDKRERNDSEVRDKILVPGQDRLTGDLNDFWKSRDYLTQITNMKAALLMCHGFSDWNVMSEHSYLFYEAAKKQGLDAKIYYNQQGHGAPPPFELMNKWFTHYLHGIDNGIEKGPKAYIVREGENYPKSYPDFPDPKAKNESFYLQGKDAVAGELSLSPNTSGVTQSFLDDANLTPTQLLKAPNSANRLLFLGPTLESDLRISGTPSISLSLSSNKAAANLSVYLVVYPPVMPEKFELENYIINRAWADPQNHQSLEHGEALQAGQFYTLNFDFMPDDQVIPKGSRIALMIFSSDNGFTLQPKPGTVLNIRLDETSLVLPIVR